MDVLMLAVIAIGFLGAVVVFIYIVDRINSLERQTRELVSTLNKAPAAPKGPYGGLSGRKLWDAMCGKAEGLDPAAVDDIRTRYADVLFAHIRATFDEGAGDAKLGSVGMPKNPRPLVTPHGPLESWLPSNDLVIIYNAGVDSINKAEFDLTAVRAGLDAAISQLFLRAFLQPPVPPMSVQLMPPPPDLPAALPGGNMPALPPGR